MNFNFSATSTMKRCLVVTILSSGLFGCSVMNDRSPVGSPDIDVSNSEQERIGLKRHLYAGIGVGPSWMDPDTSEVAEDVNERVATGGQVTIGLDVTKHLSLELHSADLGSAGLSPTGSRVNYHITGGSALLYAGKNRHNFKRAGLLGYGRIGLGVLENSIDGPEPYVKDNKTHVLFGAGLEYMTRMGLGLRAEAIAFEEDARYGQLALVYRTGRKPKEKAVEIVQAPAPKPAPVIAPIPAVAVLPEPVDTCEEITGVLEGVNFHNDSAKLTDTATGILDSVAERLSECDTTPIGITAHTDSVGNALYNQQLSEKRARSVVKYLSGRGINTSRIKAEWFGETKPIASNRTADGRRQNRRVELKTAQ